MGLQRIRLIAPLVFVVLITTGCLDPKLIAAVAVAPVSVAKANKQTVTLTGNADDVRYCGLVGDVSALTRGDLVQDARRRLGGRSDGFVFIPFSGMVFVPMQDWATSSGPFHGQVFVCPRDVAPGTTLVNRDYVISKSKQREGAAFPLRIVRRASEAEAADCLYLADVTDEERYDLVKKILKLGANTIVDTIDGQSTLANPGPQPRMRWRPPEITVRAYRCESGADGTHSTAPPRNPR
jgi:hypothetical protein